MPVTGGVAGAASMVAAESGYRQVAEVFKARSAICNLRMGSRVTEGTLRNRYEGVIVVFHSFHCSAYVFLLPNPSFFLGSHAVLSLDGGWHVFSVACCLCVAGRLAPRVS